jgi:hypothetical protein
MDSAVAEADAEAGPVAPTYEAVGRIGGTPTKVAFMGTHAAVLTGTNVVRVDLATSPPSIVAEAPLPRLCTGLVASGNFLFLACGFGGVIELDGSTAGALTPLPPLTLSDESTSALDVVVADDKLWVATNKGFSVFDVHDGRAPLRAGKYVAPVSPGSPGLAVAGGRAYLAVERGIEVVDVSVPTDLKPIGLVMTRPTQIRAAGERLYAREPNRIAVYAPATSLTEPVGTIDRYADAFEVVDSKLFLASVSNGVFVYDVSGAQPVLIGGGAEYRPRGVWVNGSTAVMTTNDSQLGDGVLRVADLLTGGSVAARGTLVLPGTAVAVAFAKDRLVALTSRGLATYGLGDPSHPKEEAVVPRGGLPNASSFAVDGDHIVSAHADGTLVLRDAANPLAEIARWPGGGFNIGPIAARNDLIAVPRAGQVELWRFDGTTSKLVGNVQGGAPIALGDRRLLASRLGSQGPTYNEVVEFDITDPAAPTELGKAVVSDLQSLTLRGTEAYVRGSNSVSAISLVPVVKRRESLDLLGYVRGFAALDDDRGVIAVEKGFQTVDLRPVLRKAWQFDTPLVVGNLATAGTYLAGADKDAGIVIYRIGTTR